jgi:hypothetical protein
MQLSQLLVPEFLFAKIAGHNPESHDFPFAFLEMRSYCICIIIHYDITNNTFYLIFR